MSITEGAPRGGAISYSEQIRRFAKERPDHFAIRFVPVHGPEESLTYAELDAAADRLAKRFLAEGADADSMIAIALPNGVPFYVALVASWRIGACPAPLKYDFTPWEQERYIDVVKPSVIVGDWPGDLPAPRIGTAQVAAMTASPEPAPHVVDQLPRRTWAIASGGSTGRPKLIVSCRPATLDWQFASVESAAPGDGHVQLICTPLYHTSALSLSVKSLTAGDTLVVIARFDAARVVEIISRYQVTMIGLVAATMVRLLRLADLRAEQMQSLRLVIAGAGAISETVLRGWADLVGAENIIVGYGASEGFGSTNIRGDELLKRPGTVGKGGACEIRIVGEDGQARRAGEIGEIYMRAKSGDSDRFEYWGGEAPRRSEDGFVSVGDLGWVDEEGYLYIADRRTDMVKTGGVNVFPAEVEAAILEHPGIADAVVLGLPDADWGRRLHAVLVAADPKSPPAAQDMAAFLKARLAPQKIPKAYEFVEDLGRADTMKLNRNAMAEARS